MGPERWGRVCTCCGPRAVSQTASPHCDALHAIALFSVNQGVKRPARFATLCRGQRVRISMGAARSTLGTTRTVEVDVSSKKALSVIHNTQHAALAAGLVGEGREDTAAIIIQRKFRGRKARREFLAKKEAAISIQKMFRGKQARSFVTRVGNLFEQGAASMFNWFSGWGAPIRAAFDNQEFAKIRSPPDANFGERLRDQWMAYMVRMEKTFLFIAAVFGIFLVGFFLFIASLMLPLNFGVKMGVMSEDVDDRCDLSRYNESDILFEGDAQYPPRIKGFHSEASDIGQGDYVAFYCTPAQWWFNVCCKYLSFYFGYVNLLPVPWTISIFANAWFPRPESADRNGVDFYGRPTMSLWFHISRKSRKAVATMLLVALLFQIPDCALRRRSQHASRRAVRARRPTDPAARCARAAGTFHAIFWHYLQIQTWPGIFLTNLPLVAQLSLQIGAAIIQARAEGKVRAAEARGTPRQRNTSPTEQLARRPGPSSSVKALSCVRRSSCRRCCCGPLCARDTRTGAQGPPRPLPSGDGRVPPPGLQAVAGRELGGPVLQARLPPQLREEQLQEAHQEGARRGASSDPCPHAACTPLRARPPLTRAWACAYGTCARVHPVQELADFQKKQQEFGGGGISLTGVEIEGARPQPLAPCPTPRVPSVLGARRSPMAAHRARAAQAATAPTSAPRALPPSPLPRRPRRRHESSRRRRRPRRQQRPHPRRRQQRRRRPTRRHPQPRPPPRRRRRQRQSPRRRPRQHRGGEG